MSVSGLCVLETTSLGSFPMQSPVYIHSMMANVLTNSCLLGTANSTLRPLKQQRGPKAMKWVSTPLVNLGWIRRRDQRKKCKWGMILYSLCWALGVHSLPFLQQMPPGNRMSQCPCDSQIHVIWIFSSWQKWATDVCFTLDVLLVPSMNHWEGKISKIALESF